MNRTRRTARRVRTLAALVGALVVGLVLAVAGANPTAVGVGVLVTLVALVGLGLAAVPTATRRRWTRPFRCQLCRGRYGNPAAHACRGRRTARLQH